MSTPNNPLTRDFAISLARLQRYASKVEAFLAAESASLEAQITDRMALLPPEDRQDHFEAHLEDMLELSDELPTLLRHSVLTAADSALERYLTDTCHDHAELSKSKVRLEDLRGGGLHRAQIYLKRVAGIEFPDEHPAWVAMLRLHELRNSIVHAEGYMQESHAGLAAWLQTIPGVQVSARRFVTLRATFLDEMFKSYDSFVEVFDAACEPLSLWHLVFPPVEDEKQA